MHQNGLLQLRLGCGAYGRTQLLDRYQRFPLRTTVPLYLDQEDPGLAFIYIQNPAGGLLAGDQLDVEVALDSGARAHLTTQSATKLYRMDGGEARQNLRLHLAADTFLEYLPDPIIPQAGSRLTQQMAVEVSDRASFLGAEVVGPGRHACNEEFAYERLAFRTEVRRCDQLLCVDASVLEPARRDPKLFGLLGSWTYVATLLVIVSERPTRDCIAERIRAQFPCEDDRLVGAVGQLPHEAGIIVRLLAHHGPTLRRELNRAVSTARECILGISLPPARK